MRFQNRKGVIWAISIAYGIIVFAGQSLHMLPNCGHHHPHLAANPIGLTGHEPVASEHEPVASGHEPVVQSSVRGKSKGCCCSHPTHCETSNKAAYSQSRKSDCVVIDPLAGHSDDCQVCRLMASLGSGSCRIESINLACEPIDFVYSAAGSSPTFLLDARIFCRGPPALRSPA